MLLTNPNVTRSRLVLEVASEMAGSDDLTAMPDYFQAQLDARKMRIPWKGEGPLPVERMAKEAPDTPQTVPLHPAAERFWRARGYLDA